MTLADHATNLQSHSRQRLCGYLFVIIAVIFWGASASLAKYLLAGRFDTVIITQTRTSFSFLLLALFFFLTDRSVFKVKPSDLFKLGGVGIIGVAATNFSYYYTVKESTVATAILVQYTAPVLVTVYAVLVSKEEKFDGTRLLSLVLAFVGCYFAVSGGSAANIQLKGWAIVSGAVSALGFSYMLVGGKRILRTYSSWTMQVYAFGFAALFWLFVNPPWDIAAKQYTAGDWGVLWFFAVVSVLIPYSMFASSLKILEASTVGIASTLEPVVAIVVAYVALGEGLNGVQMVGGAGVVLAVLLLQLNPLRMFSPRLARRDEN